MGEVAKERREKDGRVYVEGEGYGEERQGEEMGMR